MWQALFSFPLQFLQQYNHYKSNMEIFKLQPNKPSKELAELVMFMAQVRWWFLSETDSEVQTTTIPPHPICVFQPLCGNLNFYKAFPFVALFFLRYFREFWWIFNTEPTRTKIDQKNFLNSSYRQVLSVLPAFYQNYWNNESSRKISIQGKLTIESRLPLDQPSLSI